MSIEIHIDQYLELSYLKEEMDSNNVSINSSMEYNEYEIQEKRYIFDPQETGDYTIKYGNNQVSVSVYDMITEFSSTNLSNNWRGDLSSFNIDNSRSYSGSNSLNSSANYEKAVGSLIGDGLTQYPKRGGRYSVRHYGQGYGGEQLNSIGFSIKDVNGDYLSCSNNGYIIRLNGKGSKISLAEYSDGSVVVSDSVNVNPPTGEWTKYEFDFDSNNTGTIKVVIYDENDNKLYDLSIQSDTYDKGGIGVSNNYYGDRNNTNWWDYWR